MYDILKKFENAEKSPNTMFKNSTNYNILCLYIPIQILEGIFLYLVLFFKSPNYRKKIENATYLTSFVRNTRISYCLHVYIVKPTKVTYKILSDF